MKRQEGGSSLGMVVQVDIDARQQLTALACASLVPRCAAASSSSSAGSCCCWARLLPVPILSDLLAPTWVLRPARPVSITFRLSPPRLRPSPPIISSSSASSPPSPSPTPSTVATFTPSPSKSSTTMRRGRSDKEDVFFVVSHTLGLIGQPVVVEPLPWLFCGWLGSHNLLERWPDMIGCSDLHVLDSVTKKHTLRLLNDFTDGVNPTGFLCCCNMKWVVALFNRRKLHVWKVVNCVPQLPEVCVFDCQWMGKPYGLRFFGQSEYVYSQCDEIELLFTRKATKKPESICVLHVNLADPAVYSSSLMGKNGELDGVIECENTTKCEFPFTLQPLVNRSEKSFHLPFSVPGTTDTTKLVQLLHLNTGLITTWGQFPRSSVRTVDESHLAVTDREHRTTSVYNPLSELPLVPCHVLHHPSANTNVSVGCGLLVYGSSVLATTGNKQTQHTITDAVSGETIFRLWHDCYTAARSVITAVPFTTTLC